MVVLYIKKNSQWFNVYRAVKKSEINRENIYSSYFSCLCAKKNTKKLKLRYILFFYFYFNSKFIMDFQKYLVGAYENLLSYFVGDFIRVYKHTYCIIQIFFIITHSSIIFCETYTFCNMFP